MGERRLRELVKVASDAAKRVLEEKQNVPAIWTFLGPGEHMSHLPTPFENELEKDLVDGGIRRLLKRVPDIRAYVFVSEAWVAILGKDEKYTGGPVADQPNRKEMLMITGEERGGESVLGMAPILRNGNVRLGEWDWHWDTEDEGRFVRMFEK